jgi:hypothetical protein
MSFQTVIWIVMGLLAAAAIVVVVLTTGSWQSGTFRLVSAGSLICLALFCGFGFIASGEATGERLVMFRVIYGVLGGLSLAGAVRLATR